MRKTLRWACLTLILLTLSAIASAHPSYVGISGNIFTPDDVVLSPESFEAAYHGIVITRDGKDQTNNIFSLAVGLSENLEVGLASIDKKLTGGSTRTIFSGKYVVTPESLTSPAVTVGVVDVAGELDDLADISGPGYFLLISKTFTPPTEEVGAYAAPFKVHLGAGGGVYDGFFAGVNWMVHPRFSLVGEYSRRGIVSGENDTFNFGGRFSITDQLSGDVSVIDSRRLGFGISFKVDQF